MSRNLISVAPMIDCTDRHFRYLIRLISRKTLLYTEMLTIKDILAAADKNILQLNPVEPPIAIQLGGSDPAALAQCAKLARGEGYTEINLNVGCPSHRVQSGGIGACLMLKPELVAECVMAMQSQVSLPITVKCRLGVDQDDSYEQLVHFVDQISNAGCKKFIIHARKAWLQGLSPKQNRTIPPLEYEKVYRLKQDFPHLTIVINGGIHNLTQVDEHLTKADGVMIGRAIYDNPLLLTAVDAQYYGQTQNEINPESVALQYIHYIEQELGKGTKLSAMTRHILSLFQGLNIGVDI
jgi:tRNA-dihydrouridine synthase A